MSMDCSSSAGESTYHCLDHQAAFASHAQDEIVDVDFAFLFDLVDHGVDGDVRARATDTSSAETRKNRSECDQGERGSPYVQ